MSVSSSQDDDVRRGTLLLSTSTCLIKQRIHKKLIKYRLGKIQKTTPPHLDKCIYKDAGNS